MVAPSPPQAYPAPQSLVLIKLSFVSIQGPMTGLIIVDYLFIHKQKLKLSALVRPPSPLPTSTCRQLTRI